MRQCGGCRSLFGVVVEVDSFPGIRSCRVPLNTVVHGDVVVEDEVHHDPAPALVLGEVVVELRGFFSQDGQLGPGDEGEVVVLGVVANIPGEEVEWAVVGVCLGGRLGVARPVVLRRVEDVVLCHKVARRWVQGAGKEGGEEKVEEGIPAPVFDDEIVHEKLHEHVDQVHHGEVDVGDEHRAQGIEEDLEGGEERLAEDVGEHEGLDGGGQVCVVHLVAEELVVQLVVWLERGGVGDADREVRDDRKQPVVDRSLEAQVVRELVDAEEAVLARKPADPVRRQQKRPRERVCVAQQVRQGELQENHAQRDPLGQRLVARQLADVWVLLQDRLSAGDVWILLVGPEKVVFGGHDGMLVSLGRFHRVFTAL